MAVLTDIIIAPAADVPAIIHEWPGKKRWSAFETSGLDWLVLADLASALLQPGIARSIEEQDPSAEADSSDGPWLYVLPTEFRDRIADIGATELDAVAAAWSGGEEASNRGLDTEPAKRLLLEIRRMAVQARSEQKPILLWVSM